MKDRFSWEGTLSAMTLAESQSNGTDGTEEDEEDEARIRAANVLLPSPPFWGERGWG